MGVCPLPPPRGRAPRHSAFFARAQKQSPRAAATVHKRRRRGFRLLLHPVGHRCATRPCIKPNLPHGLKRVALGRSEAPTGVFLRGMAGHHPASGPQYPRRWKRQKRPAESPIEVPDSEVVGEVLSIVPPDEVAALIAAEFQAAGGLGGGGGGGPRRGAAAPPRPPPALGALGVPQPAPIPPRGISRGHGYARPLPRAALTPPAVP